MFDTCFEYDDHLRASGHWAGGEALQGPETALTLYWKNAKSQPRTAPMRKPRNNPIHGGLTEKAHSKEENNAQEN
jgi:hypothetical protein